MTSPQIIRSIYTTQTPIYNFSDSLDNVKSIKILNFTYLSSTSSTQICIRWYIKDGVDSSIWPYVTYVNSDNSPAEIIAAIQESCSPTWNIDVEYDDDTYTFSIINATRNVTSYQQIINNRIAQTLLQTDIGPITIASDLIRPYIDYPVSEIEPNIGATVIRSFDVRGDKIVCSPNLNYVCINTGGITMGLLGTTLSFTGGQSFSLSTTPTVPYPIALAENMAMVNFGASAILWSIQNLQITSTRIIYDANGIVQNTADISPNSHYCLHGNVCYNLKLGTTSMVDASITNPYRGRIADDPYAVLMGTTNHLYFYNGTSGNDAFYQTGSTSLYIAAGTTECYLSPFIGISKCPYVLADNKLYQIGSTSLIEQTLTLSIPIKTLSGWIGSSSAVANTWRVVCWSPELGKFCAVANSGTNRTMTSSDGVTWSGSSSVNDATNTWISVCWSPELGKFCAVANSGTNRTMTSSDGVTWSGSPSANDTNWWFSVCWSPELGKFCAVANLGTNRTMTSSNGVTWTGSPSSDDGNTWLGVCWSPELGKFCAVANSGSNRTMTSSDGVSWTGRPSANDSNQWYGVCWSPELGKFCAVAFSGTNRTMTSSDGITWTGSPSANDSNSWRSVCWSPDLGIFCAVAFSGTNSTMISLDGVTWTGIPSANDANEWYGVCWSPKLSKFCAVAQSGANRTMTSTLIDEYQSTRLGQDGSIYTAVTFNLNRYILQDNKITLNNQTNHVLDMHANTTWSSLYTIPNAAITNSFFINIHKLNEHAPPLERYSSGTTLTSIIHLAQCNSNNGRIVFTSPYEQETTIPNIYKLAFDFSYEDGSTFIMTQPYLITFEIIKYIYRLEDAHVSSRSNISNWFDYEQLFYM